jgi:hypothetical protein
MPPLPSVIVIEGGWEIHVMRRALEALMDFNAKKSALKQLVLRKLLLKMKKILRPLHKHIPQEAKVSAIRLRDNQCVFLDFRVTSASNHVKRANMATIVL